MSVPRSPFARLAESGDAADDRPMAQPASAPANEPENSPRAADPPRWAIHRRLYDWVLSLAHHKHSTTALFIISFTESSFFPVPPDVLQIALTLERRNRAWFYASVSTIASVLGALLGYFIGMGIWHAVDQFFFSYVFSEDAFNQVKGMYQENALEAIFLAAFTPIPYKVFTIAAGVAEIPLFTLVIASIIGRGCRFFLVALFLWWFGPPIKSFIDRYFNWACLVLGLLAIGGVVAMKYL